MRSLPTLKILGILLLCTLCISSYADAKNVPSNSVKKSGPVGNYHNDLVIHDMLLLSSILKAIPIVGPLLNSLYSTMLNLVIMFEYTTNNLLDKILRDFLPCTMSATTIHCDGIYKNGGINTILRRAVDSMPDTTPLYLIKKVLGVLLCYIDPMVIFGTLLMTGSLY